jgi:hypothetical protein
VVPAAALIARARVAVAVVDAAIEADGVHRSPTFGASTQSPETQ